MGAILTISSANNHVANKHIGFIKDKTSVSEGFGVSKISDSKASQRLRISIMTPEGKGIAVVIMGVSGAGKSTIGGLLANSLNCKFLDADDYHSQANKEKMKNGIPLCEEDRIPWLETLRDVLRTSLINNQTVILGCSALRKKYRDILRSADPNLELGSYECAVKFVLLDAKAEVFADRLERRAAEGKHFMPATLLQSQMDLLQVDESEKILKVDATLNPQAIVDRIRDSLIIFM